MMACCWLKSEPTDKMIANQAKTHTYLKDMREEMTARLEAKMETDNEKFEVLGGTRLPGWISTKPGQSLCKKT
jgi:hypothetical protein